MKYQVIRIDEPDFGCEGRPDGEEILDKVILQDEQKKEYIVYANDGLLYSENVNEGDWISKEQLEKFHVSIVG